MSNISFDNIYLFFIIIPLVILLCVPFFIAIRKDNVNFHNVTSGILHVILAVLIAFAAVGTSYVTVMTETDVYVVADVSYSANRNLDAIDDIILNRIDMPKNSRMGVITFGSDYKLITRLGATFTTVKNSGVDDSQTNVVSALEYAGSLFKDDVIKHIVLITDGKQTNTNDSNAIKRTIQSLADDNIYVDAFYIDDNIAEDANEVEVTDVSYSPNVYLNHDESVEVTLRSNNSTNVIVTLYDGDDNVLQRVASAITKGVTTVSLSLKTDEEGTFDYSVAVEADDDEGQNNNINYFTQIVSGKVNVLLITENAEDELAARNMFGENAIITTYVGTNSNIPLTVEALCQYDEIVLSSIDISKISNASLFITSLETVVSKFGKNLTTLGNTNVQGSSDDVLTQLDAMLPVRFGNVLNDGKLYTIVIDSSYSIDQNSRFANAKTAAMQLVDLLGDEDDVCVVTFYGDIQIVYNTVSASKKEDVKKAINSLQAQQGTVIGMGLNAAIENMLALNYAQMQVMLISDGVTSDSEKITPIEAAQIAANNGISVNVLDIGRVGVTEDVSSNAEKMLQNIASMTGGTYYLAEDEETLNIVFNDITDEVMDTVITSDTAINVDRPRDDVLDGIDTSSIGYVSGFVTSKAKASAKTVLSVTAGVSKDENGERKTVNVPLYAYWTYGNGRVASYTSSLTGDWVGDWNTSGVGQQFYTNMISTNTPTEKIDYPFTATVSTTEGYATVKATPAIIRYDSTAKVTITYPDETTEERYMTFDSDSYYYTFETPSLGRYSVDITYNYGGKDYISYQHFSLSYLEEYDSFTVFDASTLRKAVGTNGTVIEDNSIGGVKLAVVNGDGEVQSRVVYFTVPLLIACVVLYAIDIIIRKLKWNDIKSLFKKVS